MSDRTWRNLPYLDALRPEPGWKTDFAILTTYSADLVALVAALLALAGLDDDRGSGSKVDFANAIDQLRDRVRLLAQAGRIVVPAKTPKILGILDRYVRDVQTDEADASWHPKSALVRLQAEEGARAEWRLWIGSRNLTRDLSWDAGLTLVGRPAGEGGKVPGIAELGHELAKRADLPRVAPARVQAELRTVRWEMPRGCSVEDVRLLDGEGRSLPDPPERIRQLTIVSPFLDGTVVGKFGAWGDAATRRLLVSTQPELGKLARQAGRPLASFGELLYLDAPPSDGETVPAAAEGDLNSEDAEPDSRGLHAKIVYADHGNGRTMWFGSANATQRGWNGPNTEIIARVVVSSEVGEGLAKFLEQVARTATIESLPLNEEDEIEERLEVARKQVASRWQVVQRVSGESARLETERLPHPDDEGVQLDVGLIGGELTPWPRNVHTVRLRRVTTDEPSELLQCRLRLGESQCTWLQGTPMDPPPDEERDSRAIARYLDPRTFLAWLRGLITEEQAGDGGGDWDSPRTRGAARPQTGPTWWAPTIEDVLKAWSRDPSILTGVDRKVRRYLRLIEGNEYSEYTEEDRKIVTEFRDTWDILRRELVLRES